MRRAIVHIGFPRTGTTSLQRFCYDHRQLLSESGVLYPLLKPKSESVDHLSHQYLGEALDGRRPASERAELLGSLESQLRATAAESVLVSYEGLSQRLAASNAAGMLAALFARNGFAMEALLTVRPQAEYVNSLYARRVQFLREGRPFRRFLPSALRERAMDYEALARPWRAACEGRMTVLPLRDARSPEPCVVRVLRLVCPATACQELVVRARAAAHENRSPDPVTVEACRRLRVGGAEFQLGALAREATRWVEALAREAGYAELPFQAIGADLEKSIAQRFASANDRFARIAWGEPWAERVGSSPALPLNEIAALPQDSAVERKIVRIVEQTREHFGIAEHPFIVCLARQSATELRRYLLGAAHYLRSAA